MKCIYNEKERKKKRASKNIIKRETGKKRNGGLKECFF